MKNRFGLGFAISDTENKLKVKPFKTIIMNNLMLTKNGNIRRDKRDLGNYRGLASIMDELFNDELPQMKNKDFNKGLSNPKVNILESDEAYILNMAVPGFKKTDFIIGLENEELSISTEIKVEEEKKENYTRKEFAYASFKRTFLLPETVDETAINASYTDGILTVSIPKKEEAKPKPPRKIEIS